MFFQFAFSCCKNIVAIATFENERINELRFSEARLFNFSCKFCCWTHGQKGVIHCGALKNITLHEEWFPERQMSVKLKFSKTSVHQPVVRLKNCCFQDLHRVGSPKIVSQIDDHLINTMSVRSPKTFQDVPVTFPATRLSCYWMTSAFTRHGQNFLFVKRGQQTFYSLWPASTTNPTLFLDPPLHISMSGCVTSVIRIYFHDLDEGSVAYM